MLSKAWGSFAGRWWLMEIPRMFVIETLFHNGQALGKIQQDRFAGEVSFIPKNGHHRLAGRKWSSIRGCKAAVIREYKNENEQATAP